MCEQKLGASGKGAGPCAPTSWGPTGNTCAARLVGRAGLAGSAAGGDGWPSIHSSSWKECPCSCRSPTVRHQRSEQSLTVQLTGRPAAHLPAGPHVATDDADRLIVTADLSPLGPVLHDVDQLREARVERGVVLEQLGVRDGQNVVDGDVHLKDAPLASRPFA